MSLFGPSRRFFGITGAQDLIPPRSGGVVGAVNVTTDTAMRHSAVWACIRLRNDLISTFPVKSYRDVGGIQVEMPKPPILVDPGGSRVDWVEWMYSSGVDLDRAGNAIGLITERNGIGLPSRIDLQPIGDCAVRQRGEDIRYRIGGKDYDAGQVWHEKQFTVAGLPVGLSPIAYAAWSIGGYLSAQEFASQWYGGGGMPKAHFKNTAKPIVDQGEAQTVKAKYRAAIEGRDVLVTGRDWEFKPLQSESVGMEWLEAQRYGIGDVARFMGCPGDLIDAAVSSGSITYASITQRNLQFLIMHLGPAVFRRERALSRLLPQPRYVKLNTSALLRMDDETRAKVIATRLESRTLTPSEARALDNLPPLTDADLAEITAVYGPPKTAAVPVASGRTETP